MGKQTKKPENADFAVPGSYSTMFEFTAEMQGEGPETYQIKGEPEDRRKFYFFRNE